MRKMLAMVRRARPHPKRRPSVNFLREWREWRDYTLEDACDRLETMFGAQLTPGTLSRMERGDSALDTGWMSMFSEVYRCTMGDLVMRPPQKAHGLHEIVNDIPENRQAQAAVILQTFVAKAANG